MMPLCAHGLLCCRARLRRCCAYAAVSYTRISEFTLPCLPLRAFLRRRLARFICHAAVDAVAMLITLMPLMPCYDTPLITPPFDSAFRRFDIAAAKMPLPYAMLMLIITDADTLPLRDVDAFLPLMLRHALRR